MAVFSNRHRRAIAAGTSRPTDPQLVRAELEGFVHGAPAVAVCDAIESTA
jgi:hypothetical protein